MPSHEKYAKAIRYYDTAVDDISARVQQDRSLHMHDLTNVYMQAIATRMPSEYLTMLETTIGERSIYNDRKMVLDAADLTMQNKKLTNALQQNVNTLTGGGVVDRSGNAMKNMHYAAKRGNAMYANFNQKLAHDRSVHTSELNALLASTPPNTPVAKVLTGLLNMRIKNNATRTAHDAKLWAKLDSQVNHMLGGGNNAADVIKHGVSTTLRGGGNNMVLRGGRNSQAHNSMYRFEGPASAQLWQDVMG